MSNVCRVLTRKRTLMTAGGALAMGLALPLATAHAYPPGTSLAVAAVSSPIPGKPSNYTVTVTNGLPGCKVRIQVRNNKRTGRIGPDGTATFSIGVSVKSGKYTVKAKTLSCDVKENTSTDILVTQYRLNGPTTVRANRSFLVQARGWLPRTAITFTALDSSGKVEYAETLRTNSRGDSRNRLRLLNVGAGAVVVTQGSKSMSYPVTVVPAR